MMIRQFVSDLVVPFKYLYSISKISISLVSKVLEALNIACGVCITVMTSNIGLLDISHSF